MPIANITAGVEEGIRSLSTEQKRDIRSNVSHILKREKPPPKNISKDVILALKELNKW